VVVIDVLRAFTTAAYAFRAGLGEIELVSTVDEAFAAPGFRMGEVGGRLIPGFDHNNSPSRLVGRRLKGRGVLRTGSGTQCVAAATGADEVWLGSLVVAGATARALAGRCEVTLVASGPPHEGEEDLACAEWIASLLQGTACEKDSVHVCRGGPRRCTRGRPLHRVVLYGVSPRDPVVFGATTVAMLTAAVIACWLPARRAAAINPIEALRAE
jgi:phosphosulfolactate phosphohydrolase-like enzyme